MQNQYAEYGRVTQGRLGTEIAPLGVEASDTDLVLAIGRGDRDALAESQRRHGPRVRAAARRLCGDNGADDVVQEIFLRLWQRPGSFDPDRGSLQTFLLVQANRRAIDMLRSDSSRRSRESVDFGRPPSSTDGDVETAASVGLLRDALAELLRALPDREREVIVLAYFGCHTYREVAQILEQPDGTVKSRIRSGLGRLRAQLEEQGGLEMLTGMAESDVGSG